MKIIRVTQKLKDENPKLFGEVGSVYKGRMPRRFIRNGQLIMRYDKKLDLQDEDGWKEVIIPPITSNQKRTSKILNVDTAPIYEVVPLTESELLSLTETIMPPLEFKRALNARHGISDPLMDEFFTALPTFPASPPYPAFSVKDSEDMRTRWRNSETFTSSTQELFLLSSKASQYLKQLYPLNEDLELIGNEDVQSIFDDYKNGTLIN